MSEVNDRKLTQLTEKQSPIGNDDLLISDSEDANELTKSKRIKIANLPITSDVQTALNSKQNLLGFTAENIANKSVDTALGSSNTAYPSQNAVKTYVDNRETAILAQRIVKNATSLQTFTTEAAQDIEGLSINIGANETWVYEFYIQNGCNNTGGIKFTFSPPSGASFRGHIFATTSGINVFSSQLMFQPDVLTALAFNTVNSQSGFCKITGTIENGANAGIFQLRCAAGVDGQTATIYKESFLVANKIL